MSFTIIRLKVSPDMRTRIYILVTEHHRWSQMGLEASIFQQYDANGNGQLETSEHLGSCWILGQKKISVPCSDHLPVQWNWGWQLSCVMPFQAFIFMCFPGVLSSLFGSVSGRQGSVKQASGRLHEGVRRRQEWNNWFEWASCFSTLLRFVLQDHAEEDGAWTKEDEDGWYEYRIHISPRTALILLSMIWWGTFGDWCPERLHFWYAGRADIWRHRSHHQPDARSVRLWPLAWELMVKASENLLALHMRLGRSGQACVAFASSLTRDRPVWVSFFNLSMARWHRQGRDFIWLASTWALLIRWECQCRESGNERNWVSWRQLGPDRM